MPDYSEYSLGVLILDSFGSGLCVVFDSCLYTIGVNEMWLVLLFS